MGYDKNFKGKPMNIAPTETIHDIRKYPVRAIKERGISETTADLYGIRTKVSGEDGITPVAYYFPYYDMAGKKIIGYKKRDLLKSKKESFSAIGDVTVKQPLFGINTLLGKDKWKLYITEGEFDAACLYNILKADQKVQGKEEYAVHVTSIGMGTANAVEHIMNNMELIEQYKEVILVFDNDKSTPEQKAKGITLGQDAVEDVALALTDISVKYVKLPLKDPCEMYEAGRRKELVQSVKFGAFEYKPETLASFDGTEEEIDNLMMGLSKGFPIKSLPELSACMHGIRLHEMTVLLAPSGCGKSTISKQVGFELAKNHNFKVANFFLEEPLRLAQQSYVALYNDVRPVKFFQNPNILKREQVQEARDWMKDTMVFYDCDKASILKPESVVRMVKHVAVMGYQFIVFDHLSFVISGDDGGNERKVVDKLLTDLSLVARAYPIHIWMVSHIKRNDKYQKPKNEDGDYEYPHWMPVRKEDGRSSGAIEQLAHNIICLEPEILDEDGMKGNVRLVVRKNRLYGEERVCDVLSYNTDTGKLT